MRMIGADALINTLQELFDKREKEARFTGNRGVAVTWNDAIYHIKNAPTIEPEQRWIPCSERLPEEGESVLLTELIRFVGGGSRLGIEIAYYTLDDGDAVWLPDIESPEIISRPIAWMPLPEPYKKGE